MPNWKSVIVTLLVLASFLSLPNSSDAFAWRLFAGRFVKFLIILRCILRKRILICNADINVDVTCFQGGMFERIST